MKRSVKQQVKRPLGERCSRCDQPAVGAVRSQDGRYLEAACEQHLDPSLVCHDHCRYCDGPIRSRYVIEYAPNDLAHKKCHREACED